MLRVGIIDDRSLSRTGLREMFQALTRDAPHGARTSVVFEGRAGQAAALIRATRPDLLVSGDTSGRSSLLLLETLTRLAQPPAVLVIGERVTDADARTLLTHGAAGVLLHRSAAKNLTWALAAIVEGSRALSPELADAVINGRAAPAHPPGTGQERLDSLSPRELEVLALVSDGLPNRAIAETLHISPETVKDHVRALCTKLHAASRIQAARIAWQAGVVPSPA
jgi:DNA-binding NarL/FixJ family response regulator